MLKRLDLNSAQICELQSVLENEGDGRLLTENSVNLSIPIGFLGTRFLPLPAIDFHVRILGEERDWNVMLAQGNSGFVLLQQLRREGEQLFDGLSPVSAYPILHSQLSFATENRKSGWPCRVRSMLLKSFNGPCLMTNRFLAAHSGMPCAIHWPILEFLLRMPTNFAKF